MHVGRVDADASGGFIDAGVGRISLTEFSMVSRIICTCRPGLDTSDSANHQVGGGRGRVVCVLACAALRIRPVSQLASLLRYLHDYLLAAAEVVK